MDKIELRRSRQRFSHCALRCIKNGDILHGAEVDSCFLGELGNDRLHRYEVRRPDHPVDIGLADCLCGGEGLLFHAGGSGKRCRARNEVGQGEADTALQEPASREIRLRHDFLLACVGLCDRLRMDRRRPFRRMTWPAYHYRLIGMMRGKGRPFVACFPQGTRKLALRCSREEKKQKASRNFGRERAGLRPVRVQTA